VAKRTVALNLAVDALNYLTQFGPFGEVLHVETDVVCFGEVVEVGAGYEEEVVGPHGPDCRHFLGRVGGPMARWCVVGWLFGDLGRGRAPREGGVLSGKVAVFCGGWGWDLCERVHMYYMYSG
jgi:hypothetical protein